MGNQLVGKAPEQIFPVEHYMNDSSCQDLTFDSSLGSTRFLKVARARHNFGGSSNNDQKLVVVKVFTIQDQGVELKHDREKLLDIKRTLEGSPNCLPFQRAFYTERAGFMVRQYVKDSLYDRISTRPFLLNIEKKWIAFQLLLSIQQAHKHGICHGDIKLENIMITSWNWVLLTDFASFKPKYLPEDNPADYNYFFDTSRRRTCYIAPERFKTRVLNEDVNREAAVASPISNETSITIKHGMASSQFLPDSVGMNLADTEANDAGEDSSCTGNLMPSMDIFSAGCVLIELFTDGSPPFSFSQLLAYRAKKFDPIKVIEKIKDPQIKKLVEHMIQRDPDARRNANSYLSEERGGVFPDYFYSFLQSYMQIFSTDQTMLPDQKIDKVYENLSSILEMVQEESTDFDSDGLVIITSLVTSSMRALKFCGSKIKALEILSRLAQFLADEIILDRIVPYVITKLRDHFPSVRIAAFRALTSCVRAVKRIPISDANIFPEYILPNLFPLCHDRNDLVRATFASGIADIAQESVRFLDMLMLSSQREYESGSDLATKLQAKTTSIAHHYGNYRQNNTNYDEELARLHEFIGSAVQILLADHVNAVKQSLMEHSVTKLAIFFGKLKANDVLLSHMITFLNDKEDAQLRESFYENIVGVAAFVGWQCSPILLPLLQQGLSDPEEFVVARCITTMLHLTSLGLLQKVALYELLKETTAFLVHPNLWIRQATAGFIAAAASQMDPIDVVVKLGAIVSPFLQKEVMQLKRPDLILNNVQSPIPRKVYESIIKIAPASSATSSASVGLGDRSWEIKSAAEMLRDLLDFLEERQTWYAAKIKHGLSAMPIPEVPAHLSQLYRRLEQEEMTLDVERKLLYIKDHIEKTAQQRVAAAKQKNISSINLNETNSILDLSDLKAMNGNIVEARTATLEVEFTSLSSSSISTPIPPESFGNISESNKPDFQSQQYHQTSKMNPTIKKKDVKETIDKESITVLDTTSKETNSENRGSSKIKCDEFSYDQSMEQTSAPLNYKNNITRLSVGNCAPCKSELDKLVEKKRCEFYINTKKRTSIIKSMSDDQKPNPSWKPKGQLVAHLHEHQGGITKLVRVPESSHFLSAATDGYVKLWDCASFEGQNVANKAIRRYNNKHSKSSINAVSANSQILATGSENGVICVYNIEYGNDTIYQQQLNLEEDGPAIDLQFNDTGNGSPMLVYATGYGSIVGWDLRQALPKSKSKGSIKGTPAFKLENDLRDGILTSMAIYPDQTWTAVGTSSGVITCWDMRFQLPILKCTHPSEARIRHLVIPPHTPGSVFAAVQGNNEVGMWNLESRYRQKVLWASPSPIFSTTPNPNSVSVIYPIQTVNNQGYVSTSLLTAGTDMRIRFWDLQQPNNSDIVSFGANELVDRSSISYSKKIVDGTEVIEEVIPKSKGSSNPTMHIQSGISQDLNDQRGFAPSHMNTPTMGGPAHGHHDWISSLTLCQASYWYIISGSRDGVIKVWK